MDDHQFAYRKGRNTDDALLFTLDTLYSHLEDSKSGKVSARIMFFDFSSAFNTMQPHILANVLLGSDDVPHALVRWVLDYLTNRSQFVRIGRDVVSDIMECSTGAPQGTVLAPFLFTLYTSGIRSTDLSCPLIKFADDTALVGRIKNDDDRIYREQIANFVAECDRNYLHLNVSKTKELIIDFRRANKIVPEPVVIDSKTVDRVTEYKYLGVVMDDQLKWDAHVEYVAKRLKPRMYCLRKLVSFDVNQNILSIFYNSIISSVWSYCITSWVGNINKTSKKVLDDTVIRAGRAVGKRLPMVDEVFDSRVMISFIQFSRISITLSTLH
ncbi:putative RNA-directed DNA polymerase from mobile element jockey-like [Apostichopus japonicus]|uniref:Putative RNA-directed DNA polymerase from mobile element jockey-like n=1 Tax=Stichopus japonicus TaxID=307972 RepID=A0A2G8LCZ0_STIJA|nr:putative RNA-directed DNA polymerase from mobile element jockey-like [Apostichopus japonicus]